MIICFMNCQWSPWWLCLSSYRRSLPFWWDRNVIIWLDFCWYLAFYEYLVHWLSEGIAFLSELLEWRKCSTDSFFLCSIATVTFADSFINIKQVIELNSPRWRHRVICDFCPTFVVSWDVWGPQSWTTSPMLYEGSDLYLQRSLRCLYTNMCSA